MGKVHLSLAIHGHQPVGNFDSIFRSSFDVSYGPFLDAIERHPALRVGLHYTGPLLEWLERNEPSYLERIARLAEEGRVELLGGGLYEPVLTVLPWEDREEQIARMADRVEAITGQRPRGIWLAERVWEPELASSLWLSGVEYTILDDTHFIGAGVPQDQLAGIFVTEDVGKPVRLIPIDRKLRYLIPYKEPHETLDYLRGVGAREENDTLLLMGDDIEKFGVWPGSHKWVFEEGWIDRFAEALAGASEWLTVLLPTEGVDRLTPRGRVYIPTASYHEMMEWAMPAEATAELGRLSKRLQASDDRDAASALRFLRGGFWRSFLAKYPESNTIHKRMLDVSHRLSELEYDDDRWEEAYDRILRAQCNDGYWHGLFGGLYSPHLRAALYENIIRAEVIADTIEGRSADILLEKRDFDCDGLPEVVVSTRHFTAVMDPTDGGLPVLDYKQARFPLVNTLQRRREHYHVDVAQPSAGSEPPASEPVLGAAEAVANAVETVITEIVDSVESTLGGESRERPPKNDLARHLVYDHGPRNLFTVYVLDPATTAYTFAQQLFDPHARVAGPSRLEREVKEDSTTVRLVYERPDIAVEQFVTFHRDRAEVTCAAGVRSRDGHSRLKLVAIECNVNLLAESAHDRFYQIGSLTQPLGWRGELIDLESLALVDEWQGLRLDLSADRQSSWWCYPFYSVSLSEEGLERVYQGSSISVVRAVSAGEHAEYVGLSLKASVRSAGAVDGSRG